MKQEESVIKTKAIYNTDKTHRILLKKTWDDKKPKAAVLMTNPASADIYMLDFTTMYCINNLAALGYGGISIVNLFSLMTRKLDLKGDISNLSIKENIEQIVKTASEADVFIVAMGRISDTYKKVAAYQYALFEELQSFSDKIRTIAACDGTEGLHPLSPKLRNKWTLVPYKLPSASKENIEKAAVVTAVKAGKAGKKGIK